MQEWRALPVAPVPSIKERSGLLQKFIRITKQFHGCKGRDHRVE